MGAIIGSKILGTIALGLVAGSITNEAVVTSQTCQPTKTAKYGVTSQQSVAISRVHSRLSSLALVTLGSSFLFGPRHPYLLYSSALTALALYSGQDSSSSSGTATATATASSTTTRAPSTSSSSPAPATKQPKQEASQIDASTYALAGGDLEEFTPTTTESELSDAEHEDDGARDQDAFCPFLTITGVINTGISWFQYLIGPGLRPLLATTAFVISAIGIYGDH